LPPACSVGVRHAGRSDAAALLLAELQGSVNIALIQKLLELAHELLRWSLPSSLADGEATLKDEGDGDERQRNEHRNQGTARVDGAQNVARDGFAPAFAIFEVRRIAMTKK
jgi:hypothetical protein